MFRSIQDFISVWSYEAESTLKLFRELTDEALQQRIDTEGRSIGRLANHIIETLTEMPHRVGLPIQEETTRYDSVQSILAAYERVSNNLIKVLQQSWTDEDLEKETDMYGEMWRNGQTLFVLVTHQIHHRGQITVLMRQAGLKVPGIYGPAREEWAGMNLPVMP